MPAVKSEAEKILHNKTTLKAILSSRKHRGKKFKNIDELFKDLGFSL